MYCTANYISSKRLSDEARDSLSKLSLWMLLLLSLLLLFVMVFAEWCSWCIQRCNWLLGGSGGLLTPLTFARHRLSPLLLLLPVRTFFAMEGGDSEFANFTLPTLKTFLEARSQNVSGNKQ